MTKLPASGIHHKAQGSGAPVVLIHGLFGSLENLGVIARSLAKHYCVYSLDLPNHGRSIHTNDMSLAAMATRAEQWLDEQNLRQVAIVGHSLGGKVAMELALMHPERVRALVVADIAPVNYKPRHEDVFKGFTAVDLAAISGRTEADRLMAAHIKTPAVRSFLLKNLVKQGGQWAWRVHLQGIINDYPHVIAANRQAREPFDKPTLFIKGEQSNYIIADYWPEVTKRFPHAEIKMIAGTEHWLHAEKPAIFTGIIERFLNPLPSATPSEPKA